MKTQPLSFVSVRLALGLLQRSQPPNVPASRNIDTVAEHGQHREDRSEDEYLSNHLAGRQTDELRQKRQKEDRELQTLVHQPHCERLSLIHI